MSIRYALLIVLAAVIVSAAATRGADVERRSLKLPAGRALDLPFSDAVLVGDTLYVSGRGGIDLATMTVPDDPQEEAKLLMDSFREVLALADMTMDDLVSVTVYCPDLSLYGEFNDVYRTYFEEEFPSRAFIGSGPLLFGMRFEMQGIAVRR